MEHFPLHAFRRCIAKYPGRYPTLTFSHLDQFLYMAFAQLTYRESLRDIETCLLTLFEIVLIHFMALKDIIGNEWNSALGSNGWVKSFQQW